MRMLVSVLRHRLGSGCAAAAALWIATPAFAADRALVVDSMKPAAEVLAPVFSDSDGSDYHGRIPYNGGPVLSQVRVVAVLWGGQVDGAVVSGIGGFYSALTGGGFMHFVSEYSTIPQAIGAYGGVAGVFTISPVNTATAIADADIQAELTQQIALGVLPTADANTVYMVHFPPGITITGPGTTGVSCVDFCGYHYAGSGVTYSVLPDQSGGCAPGPPGCNTSTTTRCCGDRTAFQNLTKSASHELMETITDPDHLHLAWQDALGGAGEVGDPCNFSRIGDDAYTTVFSASGASYEAQKGFSDAAFLAGVGTHRGCVDYPATLCCSVPVAPGDASIPAATACTWLASGASACAGTPGNLTVTLPTHGGFGDATIDIVRSAPFSGVCFPAGATSRRPDFCVALQNGGLLEQGVATIAMDADPQHPNAESCFGAPVGGLCPPGTSAVRSSCCGPLVPFVVSGTTQSMETTIPGVPIATTPVPAVPERLGRWLGGLLIGLGALATSVRRARVGGR